jgi:hypothetical protein
MTAKQNNKPDEHISLGDPPEHALKGVLSGSVQHTGDNVELHRVVLPLVSVLFSI